MCSKLWRSIQLVNDSQNGHTFDGNYCPNKEDVTLFAFLIN